MLVRRLLSLVAIVLVVGGMVGRAAAWGVAHTTAYCCCGPHDAAESCHCVDCPSAHAEVESETDVHRPPAQPAMKRCVLERGVALAHAFIPLALPPTLSLRAVVATLTEPPALREPAPAPLPSRLDKPPQR
jgi:hypothetical protein